MGHVHLSAEMTDWLHFRVLDAALQDLHGLVPQTLLDCLGCVFSSF